MANPKNLRPRKLTTEEATKIGREGGKASVESKRKRKLMSQIYGAFLAERFAIKIDGRDEKITGEALVNRVVKQVLINGGPSAVTLMKEIREATEGSHVKVEAHVDGDRAVLDTSGLSGAQIEVLVALAIGVLDAPGSVDDGESGD